MDERIKKIIAKTDEEDARYKKKLRLEEEKKRLKEEKQNKVYQQEAAIWVEENLFSLIEKADKGAGYLYFSEYRHDSESNYKCKIPAYFLIEQIQKIDGLNVETQYCAELDSHDGPGYPAHRTYTVRWRPAPKKDRFL